MCRSQEERDHGGIGVTSVYNRWREKAGLLTRIQYAPKLSMRSKRKRVKTGSEAE
jgi:hypothetical protein